ncbi:Arc family DNA-binding protein [bacterium]|nr:Arc family DNA-binding protein [bacterium]
MLNIRNLPEPVHQALRERAARNGRSMEAEAREILSEACRPTSQITAEGLQAFIRQAFQDPLPGNIVDRFLQERHSEWGDE